MPQDLQDLARQEWNNPPVSTRDSPNNTSRAASGNNSTRRMLVHRRLAGRALLDGGNMTGASSDSVPVGVSGVKITVTITITEPLVDIVALTANLTASAQCLRAKQLSTYGGALVSCTPPMVPAGRAAMPVQAAFARFFYSARIYHSAAGCTHVEMGPWP